MSSAHEAGRAGRERFARPQHLGHLVRTTLTPLGAMLGGTFRGERAPDVSAVRFAHNCGLVACRNDAMAR
jgi:hypothetical protein